MLQFLGTFSRETNAPTWAAGSAALKQRFALGNLALVKPSLATTSAADIQKYFGLRWKNGTAGSAGPPPSPAIPGHWQYVGSSGATILDHIPSFTNTADFFQLLNYAINGTNSDDSANVFTTLSIGAAVIDQYDDDTAADPTTGTTTTMIEYSGGWAFGLENRDPARPSPSPSPVPSPFPAPGGMLPTPPPLIPNYVMLNRPFRNVGELGYAFRASAGATPTPSPNPKTLDFSTAASPDAAILDLFTYNTAAVRAGTVNLNTQNPAVMAALLKKYNNGRTFRVSVRIDCIEQCSRKSNSKSQLWHNRGRIERRTRYAQQASSRSTRHSTARRSGWKFHQQRYRRTKGNYSTRARGDYANTNLGIND